MPRKGKQVKAARAWLSNRRLFQLHGWLGVNVGLLLFVVCFSGAIATVSHEIEWLLNPAVRATPPAAGAPHTSWTAWYTAVQEAHPGARILSIDAPEGPRWAARATLAYSDADWRYVFVDPYTARVTGTFSEFGIPRFFRSFHKQFYIYPGALPHGVYAVGPLGLVLLLSLATGLSFYRFRWRDLLMRGPWRSPRAFWSSLHRATGMWTVPMAILITATGVWYFVERALEDLEIELPAAAVSRPAATSTGADAALWPMPIEEAVAVAERTVPDFRVSSVSFSRDESPALVLDGQTDAWLVRDAANTVRVDPYARRVEAVSVAGQLHPVTRWVHTADPLHFGTFGGVATKLFWLLAGLSSSLAILLGVRVWYLRTVPAPGLAARPAGVVSGVGITMLVLGVSVYGSIVNIGDALDSQPVARFEPLGSIPLGPTSVRLAVASAGGQLRLAGSLPQEAHETIRRGWAWLGEGAHDGAIPDSAVPLGGGWQGVSATLDLPGAAPNPARVWLAVEDRSGMRFTTGADIGHVIRGTGLFTPDEIVPFHVWAVVGLFTAVVAAVCIGWARWLQRCVSINSPAVADRRAARHASPASLDPNEAAGPSSS